MKLLVSAAFLCLLLHSTAIYSQESAVNSTQNILENHPKVNLGVNFGFFNSSIADFEDTFSPRPQFGSSVSFRLINKFYGTYNFNRYATKKTGGAIKSDVDSFEPLEEISVKFSELIHNIGLRYSLFNFLDDQKLMTSVGAGVSILSTKTREIEIATTSEFIDGKFVHTNSRRETLEASDATGYYVEVINVISLPSKIFVKSLQLGLSLNIKYDFGKSGSDNIGGFSALLGTNLIKY